MQTNTYPKAIRLLIMALAFTALFLPSMAFAQTSTTSSTVATTATSAAGSSTTGATIGDSSSTSMATSTSMDDSSSTSMDDSSSSSVASGALPAFPAVTNLPLLGSNIVIELALDDSGFLAAVTVDNVPVSFELELEDGEIKLEFVVSNANGTFTVEVKFEDNDTEWEVEDWTPAPGDYGWAGDSCDGHAISVAYTVGADGVTLGAITGPASKVRADDDDIRAFHASPSPLTCPSRGAPSMSRASARPASSSYPALTVTSTGTPLVITS